MSRVERIGDATLYLGDCMEILPALKQSGPRGNSRDLPVNPADAQGYGHLAGDNPATIEYLALITDPPYGLGDKWQGGGGSKKSTWRFDPSEAQGWDGSIAEGVERVAMEAREAVVWGGNYYNLPPSRCWLLWDKKQNDGWTTGQAEMAWTNLDRPVRVFRFAQCEQANEGPKYHPTQKPLALMAWCLNWVSARAVLDPFMGSGTTGVACAQMGRSFIGIEREPKYFDIACRRIENAYRQQPLIPHEAPRVEQQGLDL